MLELMKELSFIPESKALKLYKIEDRVIGERFDKVTYLREVLPIPNFQYEEPIFVEACRFLPLIPFIKDMYAKEGYLEVNLTNGAQYKLPYIEIEFSRPVFEDGLEPVVQIEGKLDLTILKKTALQNLVKPEMRCIYVDGRGAITCNYLQGTVDRNIVSANPILLPPDLVNYIQVEESVLICTIGDYLFYTNNSNCMIWAPKGDLEGDRWYDTIYENARSVREAEFTELPKNMDETLKRLSLFGSEITFFDDKVVVEDNFEPVCIPSANGGVFTLEEVQSVIQNGKEIYFTDTTMFLRNGRVTILVSVKEDE